MTSTARRTAIALASLATIALSFASAAHAQPNGSGSGSSSGRSCGDGSGGTMEDGEIRTYKKRHMRGSTTCTDGTRCESWSTQQGDGSWRHFSECIDDPARVVVVVPVSDLAQNGLELRHDVAR